MQHGKLLTAESALAFASAGKATLTLVSIKTGTRFTYRISANDTGETLFVGLLIGSDNESDYKYIGRIFRNTFYAGRKIPKPGDINSDAPAVKAFTWAWQKINGGQIPIELEIWHEGKCGRCGRKLTVPESINSGFGPECITRI